MQNPERRHHAAASKKGKPATVEQANEQHNPRLRQKLHTATRKEKEHKTHHQMGRRRKFYIDQSEGVHGKNQRMKEKRAPQKNAQNERSFENSPQKYDFIFTSHTQDGMDFSARLPKFHQNLALLDEKSMKTRHNVQKPCWSSLLIYLFLQSLT
ncbi:MAG: hypothetical protein SOZ67_01325 [Alloprevotella sp.]|nr:hypothetical protein [Alloprevotella sp.]